MRLTGWLKRESGERAKRRREWREACRTSLDAGDTERLDDLRARLDGLDPHGDVELELEMLHALERVSELRAITTSDAFPIVETGHRVIGSEPCHFTALVSLPSDSMQRSGRVLFTRSRSVFVGGGTTIALPWHAVQHIVRTERDVVLARHNSDSGIHLRFNTYDDAVAAVFLARKLKEMRQSRVL